LYLKDLKEVDWILKCSFKGFKLHLLNWVMGIMIQRNILKRKRLEVKRQTWVFRLKFNKSTKARTLAINIIKTFRYRLIASSVKF